MKLKVIKREKKVVKTNLDLPVYLYFQDEVFGEELVKITEDKKITVKYDRHTFTISVETNFEIEDLNFESCLTTKKHFDEIYLAALEDLNDSVSL